MSNFELPVTRYATSGDVNIAYQTMGTGPVDIVMVPGLVSHVEFAHELPGCTAFLRRLSKFARVVTFDKRGQGLSDRISDAPSLEVRMDDVRAVMDDIGSQRAVVMGFSEGSAMSVLFAATYPERVVQLVLFGGYPSANFLLKDLEERVARLVKSWGTGEVMKTVIPSQAANQKRNGSVRQDGTARGQPGRDQGALVVKRSKLTSGQSFRRYGFQRSCCIVGDDMRVPIDAWPRSGGPDSQCPIYRVSG